MAMFEVLAHGSLCEMRCGCSSLLFRGEKPFSVATVRLLQMLLSTLVQSVSDTTLNLSHEGPFDHLTAGGCVMRLS